MKRSSYFLLLTLLSSIYTLAEELPPAESSYLIKSLNTDPLRAQELQVLPPRKSTFLAVGLSALCPGFGHAYLGDFRAAGELFASYGLLTGLSKWNTKLQSTGLITAQNLFAYSLYATYRDVKLYNQNGGSYATLIPQNSLTELALAPFSWSVIKKPEVWGGLLGALTLASTLSLFFRPDDIENHILLSSKEELFPMAAFPVAIGEESLFRGFLQPALYDSLSPIGSIFVSSLAFGAAHIPNAFLLPKHQRRQYYVRALPLITTFGAYFGYLTYKNNSLKESVAIHAWYDFILFLGAYSAAQSAAIQKPSIGFSLAF